MISISLCMIVKNEEAVLARCLDSIADLMDELIIVDTGSTDRTKEIAQRYTDQIYDFEWIGDFAAARNFSFSKASKDYIYVADADEYLNEENRHRFQILKRAMLPEIEVVQMRYCNQMQFGTTYNFDTEYRGKLYKRLRQFQWVDAVHETVNTAPVIYDSDIEIIHLPEKIHAGRDFELIRGLLDRGEKLSPKLYGLYARELYIAGEDVDFLDAEAYFKEAADQEGRSLEEVKTAFCILARAARITKNSDRFFQYCLKDIASEASAEVCYELGEYFYQAGDYGEACIWYYNAAFESQGKLNIHYMGDYPLQRLAQCYAQLGNPEQAEQYRSRAEEWKLPLPEESQ